MIDVNTLTLIEAESQAYRELKQIELHQRNLQVLNDAIDKKSLEPKEVKDGTGS